MLLCAKYAIQSKIKTGSSFWLASILVFFTILRRELNHLPDLFVPSDFLLFGFTYDWWEDSVLLVVHSLTLLLLIYAWRYTWSMLKNVAPIFYIVVAILAVIQYLAENAILFPQDLGGEIEELSEITIYAIALFYLLRFKLKRFEMTLSNSPTVKVGANKGH